MHVRFNRSTNIKTTLPNTSPRVFAAIKVFKNRLQISYCPTIPKLHLFKQCHLAFLSVWGYPNPQITRWRNLQLLRVDLVDAVSQATRVCPESCMGHAWSTYSIRTYKVHVSRTAQFILFKVEGGNIKYEQVTVCFSTPAYVLGILGDQPCRCIYLKWRKHQYEPESLVYARTSSNHILDMMRVVLIFVLERFSLADRVPLFKRFIVRTFPINTVGFGERAPCCCIQNLHWYTWARLERRKMYMNLEPEENQKIYIGSIYIIYIYICPWYWFFHYSMLNFSKLPKISC